MIPNARVFLSHSSQDKAFTRRLSDDLKRNGAKVWLDEAALEPGSRWKQQLDRAIVDNDFVIAVLTPVSIESTWVRYEIHRALAHGEREGRVKLIPLLLERCNVPPELTRLQLVDFSRRGSYARGLRRLIETFEQSWTHSRHQRRPWTKKNERLALRTGILREFNGQLVFGARVAERLRTYGRRWLRGRPIYFSDHVFTDFKEYSGVAVLHAIDKRAGITDEEEIALAHESHEHLLDFLLDLGAGTGVLEDDPDNVKVGAEIGAQVQDWIPRLNEPGFADDAAGDPRAAVTLLFVELIRERLATSIPEMASFAEPLGIVINNTFGFWTGWAADGDSDSEQAHNDPERKVSRVRGAAGRSRRKRR
jgi:hypothetical protein